MRLPRDLGARVAVAVPAAAVAVAALVAGGAVFAGLVVVVAAGAAYELQRAAARYAPLTALGVAGAAAVVAAAAAAGRDGLAGTLVAFTALTLVVALRRAGREHVTAGIAVTVLAAAWIGGFLAHGAMLRELPHGGGLVLDVLLGTFLGDTAAQLAGTAWGRRRLAPAVSPNKTVEGLAAGLAVAVAAVLVAGTFQDWLSTAEALALGAAVAVAAPLGDLAESLVKRDLGIKDSGRALGPHGGVLDRVDAVMAAAVAAYWVAIALL